jgi:hypothetical protein
MSYIDIRKEREDSTNKLFKDCGVFWAFSKEQFQENKTPLKEGEKYVDIGAGGFIPQGNVDMLTKGMKEIDKVFKQQTKDLKTREQHVLYELNNHECFYTGRIEDAHEVLGEGYTLDEVKEVYKKYKAKKYVK